MRTPGQESLAAATDSLRETVDNSNSLTPGVGRLSPRSITTDHVRVEAPGFA